MITVNVPTARSSRIRQLLRPKVVAVFSYRYDAHLVPDLLVNIAPLVDGWVSWDDRAAPTPFTTDTSRRQALIEAAHGAGAEWILAVDPDERFELATRQKIRQMALVPGAICWTFDLREMYAPNAYRIDGIWGRKRQKRLFRIFDDQFPIAARQSFYSHPLHDSWVPPNYRTLHSHLNLYHLKMIDARRRVARRDLYNRLDPDRQFQSIGYDYLADESGIQLVQLPPDRQYLPAHKEDRGLWMANPSDLSSTDL